MAVSRALLTLKSLLQEDPIGPFGKLAALWFDTLVLEVAKNDSIRGPLQLCVDRGLIAQDVADELAKICIPVKSVLPTYEVMPDNPWQHTDDKLTHAAVDVTWGGLSAEMQGGEENPDFLRQLALSGGALINTVLAWTAMQSQEPCSLLADPQEAQVVNQVFANAASSDFKCFAQIAGYEVPDFNAIQWERILELRNHPFLEKFRKKIAEVQTRIRLNETKTATEILEEIRTRDVNEIVRIARPSTGRTFLKALASNLPLPIPVNPVSLGLGIKDVVDSYDRRERFGWLYFLLDLRADSR